MVWCTVGEPRIPIIVPDFVSIFQTDYQINILGSANIRFDLGYQKEFYLATGVKVCSNFKDLEEYGKDCQDIGFVMVISHRTCT